MRKSLLESFDKIYILDLHGNSKKKEVCPDGGKDENVFDIMQGVSINIFVKKKQNSKKLADVYHYDLYGKRDFKYDFLDENSLNSIKWQKLEYKEPNYFFVYKDFGAEEEYEKGFKLDVLFIEQSMGILTSRDKFVIDFHIDDLKVKIKDFTNKELSTKDFQLKYNLQENYQWKVEEQRNLSPEFNEIYFKDISYRPFDIRKIYYQDNIVFRSREKLMKHLFYDNICLNLVRAGRDIKASNYFISKYITDKGIMSSLDNANCFPLYLYQDENSLDNTRVPNLNLEIVETIEKALNLKFTPEKEQDENTFAPIDILDYIYAVLHSPTYREKYKEFLKIDFPRVPYPDKKTFWQLVEFGGKLRALHLLEDKSLDDRIIDIKGDGEMSITNKLNKKDFTITDDKVELRLKENISIVNIPLISWEFYIGGYQPAQKWLKDRVGRELSRNDMKHYNRIINALLKTDAIMKEIDKVSIA
jgi:predicted helicase